MPRPPPFSTSFFSRMCSISYFLELMTVLHLMNFSNEVRAGERFLLFPHIESIYNHIRPFLFACAWKRYWLRFWYKYLVILYVSFSVWWRLLKKSFFMGIYISLGDAYHNSFVLMSLVVMFLLRICPCLMFFFIVWFELSLSFFFCFHSVN